MKESAIKGQVTRLNKKLETLKPGELLVKPKLNGEVYHRCMGVSTSKLKLFLECPRKYQAMYITGEMEREENKAFDIGKAGHGLILEPEKFNAEFVIQPAEIKVRRGNAWDAFKEDNKDKTVITADDMKNCHGMRNSVMAHPFGKKLLTGGRAEVSYFKCDEETGLIIKCRPDYELGDLVVDVKTAASADPEEFTRTATRLHYHMQDAIYLDITGKKGFSFLAVEKKAPFVCTAPLTFDDEARRLGYLTYRKALRDLAVAIEFNHFEGYTSRPVEMGLRPWDAKKLEQLESELESTELRSAA